MWGEGLIQKKFFRADSLLSELYDLWYLKHHRIIPRMKNYDNENNAWISNLLL